MMFLAVFISGIVCGHIITNLLTVKPMQELNRQLTDYVRTWINKEEKKIK